MRLESAFSFLTEKALAPTIAVRAPVPIRTHIHKGSPFFALSERDGELLVPFASEVI